MPKEHLLRAFGRPVYRKSLQSNAHLPAYALELKRPVENLKVKLSIGLDIGFFSVCVSQAESLLL